MSEIVKQENIEAERIEADTPEIKLGGWYWLATTENVVDAEGNYVYDEVPLGAEELGEMSTTADEDGDIEWHEDTKRTKHVHRTRPIKRLVCVTEIGSNYAEVSSAGPDRYDEARPTRWRVHFNEFWNECTPEADYRAVLARNVKRHEERVIELMDEVRQITSGLGIVVSEKDGNDRSIGSGTALAAASGTEDIKAHKNALVKAKKESLPAIFKQIETEHKKMASWMKSELLPSQAKLDIMKESISAIDDRIFTVELYAGLVEDLVQVRKGKPAAIDERIRLMQRRHYMDEECLVNYEAGGMKFDDLKAFDKWLCKPENLNRILPHARCVVAFRVRRYERKFEIHDYVSFRTMEREKKLDKITFMYARNGAQVWRLTTEVEFDEELFPDPENNILLDGDQLWIQGSWNNAKPVRDRVYKQKIEDWIAGKKEWRERCKEWDALTKDQQKQATKADYRANPYSHHDRFDALDPRETHEPCTPDSVWYDDVMREVQEATREHNRIAVVLQGLIDRSEAFLPHPPWKLWTPNGFEGAIELVYDKSRAITGGEPIDFNAYRARLAESITVGSIVIGQEDLWSAEQAKRESKAYDAWQARSWRSKSRGYDYTHYFPDGNDGPGYLAKVVSIRGTKVTFEWQRERERKRYTKRPGLWEDGEVDESTITDRFTCEKSQLFNVSAYTPGDYHMFYDDPRTRENYLQWAPFLLASEDYHAGKREVGKREGCNVTDRYGSW